MDSSKLSKKPKLPKANQDRISNLPSIVTDILKRLPLPMAAKMSVLSTKWRAKWVSLRYLVFDDAFWADQGVNATRENNAIINILLHHNGPLHEFVLHILHSESINLIQYLLILSRTFVKKVALINFDDCVPIPSHLYACKELEYLFICRFSLNPPPSGFKGFANLQCLLLLKIEFKRDALASLISSPRLEYVWLGNCTGVTNLVIDAPNLKDFVIIGGFASLDFRRVGHLTRVSLSLEPKASHEAHEALRDDLVNWDNDCVPIPSHLYACKELEYLNLCCFSLNPLPSGFKGFAYLRSLQLYFIVFKRDTILGSLITSCPQLKHLIVVHCTGITNLVIDAPNLEDLVIIGGFTSLDFRRVGRLSTTILRLEPKARSHEALHDVMFNSIKLLATSCELQHLEFGGYLCQVLAAGGVTNSLSLSFNHLKSLILLEVDLGDLNVFRFILGMIQCCPCIKVFHISIAENTSNVGHQHNIEFNDRYKLNHLTTMEITGITGSSAELKLLCSLYLGSA